MAVYATNYAKLKKDLNRLKACLQVLGQLDSKKARRSFLQEEFDSYPRLIKFFRYVFRQEGYEHYELDQEIQRKLPETLAHINAHLHLGDLKPQVELASVNKALRNLGRNEIQAVSAVTVLQLELYGDLSGYYLAKLLVNGGVAGDVTIIKMFAKETFAELRKAGIQTTWLSDITKRTKDA